jgi:hypothetical protein
VSQFKFKVFNERKPEQQKPLWAPHQLISAAIATIVAGIMIIISLFTMISTSALFPGLYGIAMGWVISKLPFWLYGNFIVPTPND